MEIRKANIGEYEIVRAFYHSVIDAMEGAEYKPEWKKDIYPAPAFLRESIENEELYIGLLNDEAVAAMVLNHQCNEGYYKCDWQVRASESEITVIHVLAVHPRFSGRSLAKQMVLRAFDIARANEQKAIRLDVLKGNLPAGKLYAGLGFRYMDTVKMYYEDTGWTEFELYEYIL